MIIFLSGSMMQAMPDKNQHLRIDTLRHQNLTFEMRDIRRNLFTTSRPVEIRQQGRRLCVISPTEQLLPVYTGRGTLYTAFRLNRGTNWLNGLPRGSYIINNKRIAIN